MIIAVLSLKGGTGKTTISTNMAFAISRKSPVLLVDSDPQRSAMSWFSARDKEDENLAAVSIIEPTALKKQLPVLTKRYDHVVIDGAPHADNVNAIALYYADIVIVPITPSPYDFWATEIFMERLEAARVAKPSLKVLFVCNRWSERSALPHDVQEALAAMEVFPCTVKLGQRVVYADSAMSGLSVLETKNPKAKAEFANLLSEILEE